MEKKRKIFSTVCETGRRVFLKRKSSWQLVLYMLYLHMRSYLLSSLGHADRAPIALKMKSPTRVAFPRCHRRRAFAVSSPQSHRRLSYGSPSEWFRKSRLPKLAVKVTSQPTGHGGCRSEPFVSFNAKISTPTCRGTVESTNDSMDFEILTDSNDTIFYSVKSTVSSSNSVGSKVHENLVPRLARNSPDRNKCDSSPLRVSPIRKKRSVSRVHFADNIVSSVQLIPNRREYDEQEKDRMWTSFEILRRDAKRNVLEWLWEGSSMERAVEEEQFRRDTKGNSLHPAHLINLHHSSPFPERCTLQSVVTP